MKNELIDAVFSPLSYKVEGAKQYTRILLKRVRSILLTSINGEYFAYRTYRLSWTVSIENFQRISQFHDSRQQKSREITPGAQLYLLQRTTFEIQWHIYAQHNSWTNFSRYNFDDVAYPYRL